MEDGLLTPSLKVRRRAVTERYAEVVEGLYGGAGADAVPRASG